MSKKNNGMRPQDVVILLKKLTTSGKNMLSKQLSESLHISPSEISESLERSRIANLVDASKKHVNILALQEFLIHGIKYVFPAIPSGIVRGKATAISAPPVNQLINSSQDVYVWQCANGDRRGQSIVPLYSTVPDAVENDAELYELLALVDVLRVGRVREREIAQRELIKRMG